MSAVSAGVLREAAALMRERAKSTSSQGGEWRFLIGGEDDDPTGLVRASIGNHSWTVADTDYANDAEHIASWHPAVALAVADLLTAFSMMPSASDPTDLKVALAVATAYLGSAA